MSWPAIFALIGAGCAAFVATWLLWRGRGDWPPIPAWTWREIRQLIALIATIAGAAVLTALAWWLIELLHGVLVRDLTSPVAVILADGLVWGLKLLLAGVLLVILSLGLVIGPRLFNFKGPGGIEAGLGGGENDSPEKAAEAVAGAAVAKAQEIKTEAAP